MGYGEQEIIGKHHSLFMDAKEAQNTDYKKFWEALAAGKTMSGRFKRFAKGQKEIWLQGYYSPINDSNGQPYKIVKYASDITEIVLNEAIEKKNAIESLKIKSMIDSASTNMMMADNDGIITFMNPSTQALMNESARSR
jgi:methyl-accepting chemotaxis protein